MATVLLMTPPFFIIWEFYAYVFWSNLPIPSHTLSINPSPAPTTILSQFRVLSFSLSHLVLSLCYRRRIIYSPEENWPIEGSHRSLQFSARHWWDFVRALLFMLRLGLVSSCVNLVCTVLATMSSCWANTASLQTSSTSDSWKCCMETGSFKKIHAFTYINGVIFSQGEGEEMNLPSTPSCQIRSPVPGMGYLFLSCWSMGPHRSQCPIQTTGNRPETPSKTLLYSTPLVSTVVVLASFMSTRHKLESSERQGLYWENVSLRLCSR